MSKVPGDTAATPTATLESTPSFEEQYKTWTPEQKREWALNGTEPEISSPTKKETAAATPEKEEVPNPTPEAAPEKEKQEPRRDRSSVRKDRKIGELTATNRQLQRELEELKQSRQSSNAAAAERTERPKDGRPQPPEEPDFTEFETLDEYKKARADYRAKRAKYEDDLLEWNSQRNEAKAKEATAKAEAEQREQSIQKHFDKRADEFRKSQKDYDEDSKASPVFEAAFKEVIETFKEAAPPKLLVDTILESDQGPALVLHLGTNVEELDRILDLSPSRAIAEIGKLEVELSKAPKPVTKTKAPAPGTRVNANTQATGDPIEDAYARGDFQLGAKLEAERDAKQRMRR